MNEQLWKYQNNGGIHMQITDVRVRKVTKEGKMKAVVSITIDNEFVVHDIKVIDGEKGFSWNQKTSSLYNNSSWSAFSRSRCK